MDLSNFKNDNNKKWKISEEHISVDKNSVSFEIPFDEMPIRVSNSLKRNGIFKLNELIGLEEKDYLFQFKNFGTKAFLELRSAFETLGLKIPVTSDQLKRVFPNFENNDEFEEEFDDKEKFLQFKITYEELGFPLVISDSLKWYGFFDLSDLIGLEEKDFLNFKDIDINALDEIKVLLDSFGLKIPISLSNQQSYCQRIQLMVT